MSLLNRAANALTHAPVVGGFYRGVANNAARYVDAKDDKEARKYMKKSLAPFAIAAGGVAAAGGAAALAGRGALAAGAVGRSALARAAARRAVGRAASRTAQAARRTGSALSRAAKTPAAKTAAKVGGGTAALGAVGSTTYNQFLKQSDKPKNDLQKPITHQSTLVGFDPAGAKDRGLSTKEVRRKYGDAAAAAYQSYKDDRKRQKRLRHIGQDWDSIFPELSRVEGDLEHRLGSAHDTVRGLRESWLSGIDETQRQGLRGVEEQEQLLRKEQRHELSDLAKESQRKQFAQNLRLGAMGAADSSAAMMATRGIQKAVERQRRSILQQVSRSIAQLEQERRRIRELAEYQRRQAYQMERQIKQQLIDAFKEQLAAIQRLKKRAPEWKKKDLDREEEQYLTTLTQQLSEVEQAAQAKRDEIHQYQAQSERQLEDLKLKAALTFAPPELEAQPVDDMVNLTDETITDYFDPQPTQKKKKPKKKVKSVLDIEDNALDL